MTVYEDRQSDFPIDVLFLKRWSPRAFTGEAIPQETLMTIFESARWAPSCYNSQPWRFIYGLRGTPEFERILALLVPQNQVWAVNASMLAMVVSKTMMTRRGTEVPNPTSSFDTGAAWQNLALQATLLAGIRMGWRASTGSAPNPSSAFPTAIGWKRRWRSASKGINRRCLNRRGAWRRRMVANP